MADASGAVVFAQSYEPYGKRLNPNGEIGKEGLPTAYGYTGEWQEAYGPERVYLRARWYAPGTGRFMSRDTWGGDANQPASYNKWLYANANPIRYNDPSGHCIDPDSCPQNVQKGSGPVYKWSTTNISFLSNNEFGQKLAEYSTKAQHVATFFSFLGGSIETGFTIAGGLGGSAVLAPFDGISPAGDFGGGLGGCMAGYGIGHKIHQLTTDKVESFFSSVSSVTTLLSDVELGNTRLEVTSSNLLNNSATVTLGESTATSYALTTVGNHSSAGVLDFPIDLIGSAYNEGFFPGVYDLLGVKGKSITLFDASVSSFHTSITAQGSFHIQFGDKP